MIIIVSSAKQRRSPEVGDLESLHALAAPLHENHKKKPVTKHDPGEAQWKSSEFLTHWQINQKKYRVVMIPPNMCSLVSVEETYVFLTSLRDVLHPVYPNKINK